MLCLDCEFADGVKKVLPLLFFGPQTLFVFVEAATQSPGLLGPQVQGLVLLALKRKKTKHSVQRPKFKEHTQKKNKNRMCDFPLERYARPYMSNIQSAVSKFSHKKFRVLHRIHITLFQQ